MLNLSLKGNAPPSSPPLDDITYHKYADETIDLLMDFLDALGDGHDIPGYDAVYAVRFLQYGLTKIRAGKSDFADKPLEIGRIDEQRYPRSIGFPDAAIVQPVSTPMLI